MGEGVTGVSDVAGTSSALSRIDGSSGGGPSLAHLPDSYLERMKESNLLVTNMKTGT